MIMIVCLDDRGGMMFNHRRQSRDRVLIEDVIRTVSNENLYITKYSEQLFSEVGKLYSVVDDFDFISERDYAFLEDRCPSKYKDNIDKIIIYRWNRAYPFDMRFDIDLEKEGFKLLDHVDFAGYSHEKITKEIFEK